MFSYIAPPRRGDTDLIGPPMLPGEVIGTLLQEKDHVLAKVQQRVRRMMLTPIQALTEIGRIIFREMKSELVYARPPLEISDSLLDRYLCSLPVVRMKTARSAAALVMGIVCINFTESTATIDAHRFAAVSKYAARRYKIRPASVISHARYWIALLEMDGACPLAADAPAPGP